MVTTLPAIAIVSDFDGASPTPSLRLISRNLERAQIRFSSVDWACPKMFRQGFEGSLVCACVVSYDQSSGPEMFGDGSHLESKVGRADWAVMAVEVNRSDLLGQRSQEVFASAEPEIPVTPNCYR